MHPHIQHQSVHIKKENLRHLQRGLSLIELLVAIAIGLLVITVGLGALMVSRQTSGAVSDISQMQQQASYALRVMGNQIKQAGSLQLLNINPTTDQVAFVTTGFDRSTQAITGNDNPGAGEYMLTVALPNYQDQVFQPTPAASAPPTFANLQQDCNGDAPAAAPILQSQFVLRNGELRCRGTLGNEQPLISDVVDLRMRYLVQSTVIPSLPTIQYMNATEVTNAIAWPRVYGVEVCLELQGAPNSVPTELQANTYTNCQGASTALGSRMHMVFRKTYQLRAQGQG